MTVNGNPVAEVVSHVLMAAGALFMSSAGLTRVHGH